MPVLAAGCAVNFALFTVFCLLLPRDNIFKLLFGGANLVIGIFNLLPLGELDGKRLLERACCRLLSFESAERVLRIAELSAYLGAISVFALLIVTGRVNLSAVTVMAYVFLMDILTEL